MKCVSMFIAAGLFLSMLSAEEKVLECLYVGQEEIILEDGSLWVPKERVFLHRGDKVTVDGLYEKGSENEEVECTFNSDEGSFLATLDSFVQIETFAVEKSCPFHLKLRVDVQGETNEAVLGGQLIRSSQKELVLWAGEGLFEEKLSQGTRVLVIEDQKGNQEILHPVFDTRLDAFYRLASTGAPERRRVESVTAEGIVFKNIEDELQEYRIDFDFDPNAVKEQLDAIEDSPVEAFKAEVLSFNPMICKMEITTKEGQSILFDLVAGKYVRALVALEDITQDLSVEVEFSAGQELGEALELGPYAVGDEFLAYPLTFYPIKGAEEFFSQMAALGVDLDITKIEDIYFLERL